MFATLRLCLICFLFFLSFFLSFFLPSHFPPSFFSFPVSPCSFTIVCVCVCVCVRACVSSRVGCLKMASYAVAAQWAQTRRLRCECTHSERFQEELWQRVIRLR